MIDCEDQLTCDVLTRNLRTIGSTATRRRLSSFHACALVLVMAAFTHHVRASSVDSNGPNDSTAAAPAGIVPIPDYSGDLPARAFLTGDWGGVRTDLANKGVQFNVDWTQIVQSVVDGGSAAGTRYGGNLDYNLTVDLMRMNVLPGALIRVRAESRYGDSVNDRAGSILPVNTDAFFPLTRSLDDDIAITLTNVSYTQFLSPNFGIMLGKFDTLDGDPNEFASGRGTSQFMDANFVFNSAMALRLPYSTLGGGMIWLPVTPSADGGITVSSLIFETTDSSTTSGFRHFDDGLTWITEADFQYRLGQHLPGGQNVGVLYSFDQDFAKIGSRLVFRPGEGLVKPKDNDTWAVYWSGWQYLFVNDTSNAPINLTNGIADRQGLGLFARAGLADHDTNPVEWTISAGVGGRGVFGRTNDTYGVGYFYANLQTTRFSGLVGIADHAQGVEAFYNLGLTPAAQLTFDTQVINSVVPNSDTAVILGARLRLLF